MLDVAAAAGSVRSERGAADGWQPSLSATHPPCVRRADSAPRRPHRPVSPCRCSASPMHGLWPPRLASASRGLRVHFLRSIAPSPCRCCASTQHCRRPPSSASASRRACPIASSPRRKPPTALVVKAHRCRCRRWNEPFRPIVWFPRRTATPHCCRRQQQLFIHSFWPRRHRRTAPQRRCRLRALARTASMSLVFFVP